MAICKSCGSEIADGVKFCAKCGAKVEAPESETYSAPVTPAAVPTYTAYNVNNVKAESTWDGGVLETVINSIVASLIISFTCGIATPWAICYMMKFIIEHAVIDGKRMTFDGNGAQLFGNWIKWFLLSIVTCGIYIFWVIPRMYKWIASHIHAKN